VLVVVVVLVLKNDAATADDDDVEARRFVACRKMIGIHSRRRDVVVLHHESGIHESLGVI
jgi:hypothetical protein